MPSDLMDRRSELRAIVTSMLVEIEAGRGSSVDEVEAVDFKEESGRRGRGGILEPGERVNSGAADKLADEVCCLANTPGGGALIVGIEDKAKEVLGTELDVDWLRQRIFALVDVAPAIEEVSILGQRILVLYVAEAHEPVSDRSGKIRWRVGDSCQPVDRAEWWLKREGRGDFDPMAKATTTDIAEVTAGALNLIRRWTADNPQAELPEDLEARDLLNAIGAIRPHDVLSQAAKLLLCRAQRSLINFTVLSVPGGDIVAFIEGDPNLALLEQLRDVENQIDARNPVTVVSDGFAERRMPSIPGRAVREAVLNALIHRDWNTDAPTEVTWIEADDTLIVRNPGGFTGGISEGNLLTNRHSRYPALADLFRALGLVDKQGVGVDRMYTSMIAIGHEPPHIVEGIGPSVTCTLIGGPPVAPVMQMVAAIRPEARQKDIRIAVILHALLHRPFLLLPDVALQLQTDETGASIALRAASTSTIDTEPIIALHKDAWVLGAKAFRMAKRAKASVTDPTFLGYATTDREALGAVVREWLLTHPQISTGDLNELTGISRPTAAQVLRELDNPVLVALGAGRTARFEPVPNS